jgi:predicted Zn-dependent protease
MSGSGEMMRHFAYAASFGRRHWRLVLVLALGAVLLAISAPVLWAGYHWHAGQAALGRYHSGEARAHLDNCLWLWPWSRSVRAHVLAARAARREGDFDEALRHLHTCRDTLHDTSPESLLEWTMLRAEMGDLDTATEPLKAAVRRDPQQAPLVLEALAKGYMTMSRILDALRTVDNWLALEPDSVQAWVVRGRIHRQVGAAQEAAKDFQHVLERDPDYPHARWWLAQALTEFGRYDEAVAHLESLHRQNPNDVDVRVQLAVCRQRMGHDEEARTLLDGVLAEQPDHGLALRARGQMALSAGQFADAETWLARAARVLPYDYKAQHALWECLRQQGKTEAAEVQRRRADTLYERRQRQSEILTHLMSQKPDDLALQCELGRLYIQLGNPDVGEAWLLNVLRLDETYQPALDALADYHHERGQEDQAEEYRRRARQTATLKSRNANAK